jgi:hypothetical protein
MGIFGSLEPEPVFRFILYEFMLTIPDFISPILSNYSSLSLEEYITQQLTNTSGWGSFGEIIACRNLIERDIYVVSTD